MDNYADRRTSVTSFKRNNSVESIGRNSADGSRRNSRQDQHIADQNTESILVIGETSNSYVQSKFCRKGSVQYRNAGWKSSITRHDSNNSIKSNSSGKKIFGVKDSMQIIAGPQLTSEEQKVYIQQKFIDIANILKDSGVDEKTLHKIRNVD